MKPNRCIFKHKRAGLLGHRAVSPPRSCACWSPSSGMCGRGLCRPHPCGRFLFGQQERCLVISWPWQDGSAAIFPCKEMKSS